MKITATQYANTLYELAEGKKEVQINAITKKFTELLIKNGQLKLAGKIIEKFSEIYNQKNGIVEVEIVSREKLSGELVNKLDKFVKEKYKAKKVVLINKIDENIKGGIVIKVGDEIVDASISGKLRNLRSSLEK